MKKKKLKDIFDKVQKMQDNPELLAQRILETMIPEFIESDKADERMNMMNPEKVQMLEDAYRDSIISYGDITHAKSHPLLLAATEKFIEMKGAELKGTIPYPADYNGPINISLKEHNIYDNMIIARAEEKGEYDLFAQLLFDIAKDAMSSPERAMQYGLDTGERQMNIPRLIRGVEEKKISLGEFDTALGDEQEYNSALKKIMKNTSKKER